MTAITVAAVSYDLRGAAEATGVSVSTIQAAVAAGDLVASYVGRKPVFRAVELDAWVASLPNQPQRKS